MYTLIVQSSHRADERLTYYLSLHIPFSVVAASSGAHESAESDAPPSELLHYLSRLQVS